MYIGELVDGRGDEGKKVREGGMIDLFFLLYSGRVEAVLISPVNDGIKHVHDLAFITTKDIFLKKNNEYFYISFSFL